MERVRAAPDVDRATHAANVHEFVMSLPQVEVIIARIVGMEKIYLSSSILAWYRGNTLSQSHLVCNVEISLFPCVNAHIQYS